MTDFKSNKIDASLARLRLAERRKYDEFYFENHYWAEDLPNRVGNRNLSYDDPEHFKRFKFIADTLISTFSFQTILDAGCGTGMLMSELSAFGKAATGIDASSQAARIYSRICDSYAIHPSFIVGSLDALPFEDYSFDITWCSDVLEHIPFFDVEKTVSELVRVSRRNIALTINLDNPYEYHPTILSRESWDALFLCTGLIVKEDEKQALLQELIHKRYIEYDVFVYSKS